MDELWTKLFRVMDDHHEATRLTATKTAKVLSKVTFKVIKFKYLTENFSCVYEVVILLKVKLG